MLISWKCKGNEAHQTIYPLKIAGHLVRWDLAESKFGIERAKARPAHQVKILGVAVDQMLNDDPGQTLATPFNCDDEGCQFKRSISMRLKLATRNDLLLWCLYNHEIGPSLTRLD